MRTTALAAERPLNSLLRNGFGCGLACILYTNRRLLTTLFRVLNCNLRTLFTGQECVRASLFDAFAGAFCSLHDSLVRVLDGVLRAVRGLDHDCLGSFVH